MGSFRHFQSPPPPGKFQRAAEGLEHIAYLYSITIQLTRKTWLNTNDANMTGISATWSDCEVRGSEGGRPRGGGRRLAKLDWERIISPLINAARSSREYPSATPRVGRARRRAKLLTVGEGP